MKVELEHGVVAEVLPGARLVIISDTVSKNTVGFSRDVLRKITEAYDREEKRVEEEYISFG